MSANGQTSALDRASREWLSAPFSSSEPAWLLQQRDFAREYFKSRGLPKSSDEAFRFLPLGPLASKAFHRANGSSKPSSIESDAHCVASIRFVDGKPVGEVGTLPTGLFIERLKTLLPTRGQDVERHLGRLAKPINGFAALGLALFDDAWVVRVQKGVNVELPLEISIEQHEGGVLSLPRLLVILEPGSHLTLVEQQVASSRESLGISAGIFEFVVGEGAELKHVRITMRNENAAELSLAVAEVHADAHYHSWVGSLGGALTRLDTQVKLVGSGARVDLDGLYVARNRECVDHHTVVVHECQNTSATETYRGILDDEAQAIFDGLIVVRPGAQQTNAQQYNRNLILSDSAVVHSKPQLEIEADDVVCNHGATVGRLDPQQLFYLQSRGISAAFAKQLLTAAFANELIDRCPHAALVPMIRSRVASHLGTSEAIDW